MPRFFHYATWLSLRFSFSAFWCVGFKVLVLYAFISKGVMVFLYFNCLLLLYIYQVLGRGKGSYCLRGFEGFLVWEYLFTIVEERGLCLIFFRVFSYWF